MAEVKWIKLMVGMFDGFSFKRIKKAKIGGESYRDKLTAVWFELMDFAGKCNHMGQFINENEIPFTNLDDIAIIIDREPEELELCMRFFINEGMVEIVDNVYALANWEKYQNTDRMNEIREYNRLAQRRSRERRKALTADVNDNVNDKSMICQRCHETEIEYKNIEYKSIEQDYSIPKSIDTTKDCSIPLTEEREEKEKGKTKVFPKKKAFPESAVLDETFAEYKRMRVAMKKPMTDRAVTLATNNIRKLATDVNGNFDEGLAIKIIEQSIQYNWLGFFELKDGAISHSGQSRSDRIKNRIAEVDSWHI